MNQSFLSLLTRVSHLTRSLGLVKARDTSAAAVDYLLIKVKRLPLSLEIDKVTVQGYFRHARFFKLLAENGFESYSRDLYLQHLHPGTVVVDGGSHIGLYSLIGSRAVGSIGKVYAFEPDPINFGALAFNIAKNKCGNVAISQKALSNSVGYMSFHQSTSSLSGSLVDRKDVEQRGKITVETTTLDEELADVEVDSLFIKLDLEGAEPLALKGMSEVLGRAGSAAMLVEVNPLALQSAGLGAGDLIGELERLGLQIHYVDEDNRQLIPVISGAAVQKGNLYCTKQPA